MENIFELNFKLVMEKYKKVIELREEILTAFVSKYEIEPDKIVVVEWKKSDLETIWFVKTKDTIKCCECDKKLINL